MFWPRYYPDNCGLPRERGHVRISMSPRHGRRRSLAEGVIACALGVWCLISTPSYVLAGVSEEAGPAATPAASAPESASPDAIPFVGNIELKARLEVPGRL